MRNQLLPQSLSSAYQNSKNLENVAQAQKDQSLQLAAIRAELEKTRNEFSDYKAQHAKQHKTDAAQAVIDKKKQRRHEYAIAAFTVALTLALEHIFDLIKFAKLALKSLLSLFS